MISEEVRFGGSVAGGPPLVKGGCREIREVQAALPSPFLGICSVLQENLILVGQGFAGS